MIKSFARVGSAVLLAWAATAAAPAVAAPINIDVRVGPPALRHEVIPAQRAGHDWTPGYWDWRYNRHHWVPGTWVAHRPGYVYTQPTWVNDNGRWHLYRGAWARGYGDRDRDGVPNRYDRDRDGDGVRNRNDRRPDNPNRR